MTPSFCLSRRFVVLGGGALFLSLAGCGQTFDMSSEESLKRTFRPTVDALEAQGKNFGLMFEHALYRAANPVSWVSPGDDFDPLKILRTAVDRGVEPDAGTDAYFDSVWAGRNHLEGRDPRAIVRLYVIRDSAELKDQLDWAVGFEARARLRKQSVEFDARRRDSLITRFTPSKSSYRWTYGDPRVPLIDFSFFNPLDRPVSGVDFAADLITPFGTNVGSGVVKFRPLIPIAPGVGGSYSVDVSNIKAFSDTRFIDLKDPLAVSLKVINVFVGDGESVISPVNSTAAELEARRVAIGKLRDDIIENKRNLFLYRKGFF